MTRSVPPNVAARMAISGSIVERRDTNEVLSIIGRRLGTHTPTGLAIGSVNLDHLRHFKNLNTPNRRGPQWLVLADGMPIALRGRMLTGAAWPRVAGADLLPRVLELAEHMQRRVGFLGGTRDAHQLLTRALAVHYPMLQISGMWSPERRFIAAHSPELAADIRAAHTDILVVSLGKPTQEHWVEHHGAETGARIFLPFGGAADFLAGKTRRAPARMQSMGLEWLYRLTQEPRRLAGRYLLHGPAAMLAAARAQLIVYPGVCYGAAPPVEQLADPPEQVNGHAVNGHAVNGYAVNGYAGNGHVVDDCAYHRL